LIKKHIPTYAPRTREASVVSPSWVVTSCGLINVASISPMPGTSIQERDGVSAYRVSGPPRGVGWTLHVHVVSRDDSMLRFLDCDQLATLMGVAIFPLRIVSVCGSKILSTLFGTDL
jgi:hypothetical protein